MPTLSSQRPTEMYYLSVLRAALFLEIRGMQRSRSPSAYAEIKRHFGFRGNRERVYTQLCEYIEKQRAVL